MSAQALTTTAQPESAAGPVATTERIEVVDMLRGFALLGILLVNMAIFKGPGRPPGQALAGGVVDRLVDLAILLFAEGKFFTLFSFLFGFGFSIQLLRAQQRGVRFVPRFMRRLLILLLFGLAHAFLLWYGDILVLYALLGFVLILFRNRSPRALLIWASILLGGELLLLSSGIAATELARATPEGAALIEQAEATILAAFAQQRVEDVQIYGGGTYRAIFSRRVTDLATVYTLLLLYIPPVISMFLFGLYAGKQKILRQPAEHLPLLRRARVWCLSLGLLLNLLIVVAQTQLGTISALLATGLSLALGGPILSLGYAATLTLLAQRERWQRRLAPLAATGRMALTNYLLQTLICTTVFYGYGFGLYGQVGPAAGLVLSISIYALQLPFSMWWLRRFQFGPMEWLWRSLTYLRPQPMRQPALRATG